MDMIVELEDASTSPSRCSSREIRTVHWLAVTAGTDMMAHEISSRVVCGRVLPNPRMSPAERRQMMLAGPIVPTILALAAPNVLNVAMQSLVSISDSWFVGQLGIVDLAALALVFPTQMALGQMSAGAMGGGISSSVARALGSGNRAAAEAAAAHALVIALGMAALFAIVFVGFGRPIYGALGGSGRALDRRRGLRHGPVPRLRRALDRQLAWPRCCAAPAT